MEVFNINYNSTQYYTERRTADRRRQVTVIWPLRGFYSDTTQLDVELSCVAINTP